MMSYNDIPLVLAYKDLKEYIKTHTLDLSNVTIIGNDDRRYDFKLNETTNELELKVKSAGLVTGSSINTILNKDMVHFKRSEILPSHFDYQQIGYEFNSIITWYDETKQTQYWYSDNDVIEMNTVSSNMFKDCINLETVDLSGWDCSNVYNLSEFFNNCTSLTNVDNIQDWNTNNVINISNVFVDCSSLTTIDLNWNLNKVENMTSMFYGCSSLENISLNWSDITNLTYMSSIFMNCSSITSLDLTGLDISKVESLRNIFNNCTSLTTLNLDFNNNIVTDLTSTFQNCSSLTTLDLSNLDTTNVTSMKNLFNGFNGTITYSDNFIYDGMNVDNLKLLTEENPTYGMYGNSTSNKVGWNTGNFDDNGTFKLITFTTFINGSTFNSLINQDMIMFNRSINPPITYEGTVDISENQDQSIVTWFDFNTNIQYWYSPHDELLLPESPSSMFMFCRKLTSLDLSFLDTSNVTNLGGMFYECNSLASLNVSNWDTSKVTNLNAAFIYCTNLTSLDLSHWDVSQVTAMSDTFYGCSNLTSLNLANWNTSNVINMARLFASCEKLSSLDISNWDTSSLTIADNVFQYCYGLATLDLSSWDTSKVTSMKYMFANTRIAINYGLNFTNSSFDEEKLTVVNIQNPTYNMFGNSTITNKPLFTGDGYWASNGTFKLRVYVDLVPGTTFNGIINKLLITFTESDTAPTSGITTTSIVLDNSIADIVTWYDSATRTQYYYKDSYIDVVYANPDCTEMFSGCGNATTLDLADISMYKTTTVRAMFSNCSSLESIDLSHWDLTNMVTMFFLFNFCTKLKTLDLSAWDTSNVQHFGPMFQGCHALTTLDISTWNTVNVNEMGFMFAQCKSLTSIDISHFNTHKVTYAAAMFADCEKLTSLSLPNPFLRNNSDFSSMFENCLAIQTLDLTYLNASRATTFKEMFRNCQALTTLTAPFSTPLLIDISYAFRDCRSLTALNLSTWNVSNVTNIIHLFRDCHSLVSVDLSTWNLLKAASAYGLFCDCRSLTTIDITWNIPLLNYTAEMFRDCISLTSLDLTGLNTSLVTDMRYMFRECTLLTNIIFDPTFTLDGIDPVSLVLPYDSFNNMTYAMFLDTPSNKPTWIGGQFDSTYGTFKLTTYATMTTGFDFNDKLDGETFDKYAINKVVRSQNPPGADITPIDISKDGDGSVITWSAISSDLVSVYQYIYSEADIVYFNSNCTVMFNRYSTLTDVEFHNFNTSKVEIMDGMFDSCSSLTSLDLSSFDASNVISLSATFIGCSSLISIDFTNWNTPRLSNMYETFSRCNKLTSLDLSSFNTSKLVELSGTFFECTSLTSLNLSNWNTSNISVMNSAFSECSSLTSLDLSSWDTSKVFNMKGLFSGCTSLTSIIYGSNFNNNGLDMDSLRFTTTDNPTYQMFLGAPANKPTGWEDGSWESGTFVLYTNGYLTTGSDFNAKFFELVGEPYVAPLVIARSETPPSEGIITRDISRDQDNSIVMWKNEDTNFMDWYSPHNKEIYANIDSSNMFKNIQISGLDVNMFNFEMCTNMSSMFENFSANLYYSEFNTSNVIDMSSMFKGSFKNMPTAILNFADYWDISKVTNMSSMFENSGATEIGIGEWNTSKVTNMQNMFRGCSEINTFILGSNFTNIGMDSSKMVSVDIENPTFNMFDVGFEDKPGWATDMNTSSGGYWSAGTFVKYSNTEQTLIRGTDFRDILTTMSQDTTLFLDIQTAIYPEDYMNSNYTDISLTQDKSILLWMGSPDSTSIPVYISSISKTIALNADSSHMFEGLKLTGDFDDYFGWYINLNNLTDTSYMFNNCIFNDKDLLTFALEESQIENMISMFNGCKGLFGISIGIYNIRITPTNLQYMCKDCTDLENFNMDHHEAIISSTQDMFLNCTSIRNLNLNLNSSTIGDTQGMFYNCPSITSLDVSSFDTSLTTNMTAMFYNCTSLTGINYGEKFTKDLIDITTEPNPTGGMFYNCYANKPNWTDGFWNHEGTYVAELNAYMIDGPTFNAALRSLISDIGITEASFAYSDMVSTDITPYDISQDQNDTIVMWYDDPSKTIYYSGYGATIYANSNSSRMFLNCNCLTSIDLSNFNTSNATIINAMFLGCSKLTSLNVSNFNTSNVTDMNSMFVNCSSLTTLDLSNFDTSKVVKIYGMFSRCSSLTTLDLSSFNTSNVTDMSSMFVNCSSLTTLDLSNFDTSKVTTMKSMFSASGLTSLNISSFNTSNVTNMASMFTYNNVASLNLSSFNTPKVTDMNNMFANSRCTSIDLSNFNTSNVIDMNAMFYSCHSLTTLDLSNFDTSNVIDMSYIFDKSNNLTNINYSSNFINTKTSSMNYMFRNCPANKPDWTNGYWDSNGTFILYSGSTTLVTGSTFNSSLTTGMRDLIRANIIDTSYTSTDISEAQDGSAITWYNSSNYTQYWFSACETIYLNPNSSMMFRYIPSSSLDLSHFDTSKVTKMGSMFSSCTSLTTLDLSNFNTPNVTDMSGMFQRCTSLTSLNLSNFNTSNVISMSAMFNNCNSLKSLNISSFDTSKVTYMDAMFEGPYRSTVSYTINYGSKFNNNSLIRASYMFNFNSSTKPNWTNGTWNSSGTFTKS